MQLFDLTEVLENADEPWKDCAWRGLEALASTGIPFTANDITELGVPDPDHSSRWGALFRAAHQSGVIKPVGYTQSTRETRHGGIVRLWVGVPDSEDEAA